MTKLSSILKYNWFAETVRFLFICLFVGISLHFFRVIIGGDSNQFTVAGIILSPLFYWLGLGKHGGKRSIFALSLTAIPVVLIATWAFFVKVFGRFDLGAFMFHMTAGVEGAGIDDLIEDVVIFSLLCALLIFAINYLARRDTRFALADKIAFLPLLFVTPFFQNYVLAIVAPNAQGISLAEHYIAPTSVTNNGADKKNLILLYLESTEETFGKIDSKEPIFDELNTIGEMGTRISGIQQVADTGWTLAGIVASQCGVPLQPLGLISRNNFGVMDEILPKVECLGEIMKKDGYQTMYLGGASAEFAGKGSFLRSHGYDDVYSLETYADELKGYQNYWGMFDDTLFEKAVGLVDGLEKSDKPYLFSMLTIGGHRPGNFIDRACREHFGYSTMDDMRYSIRCNGWHTAKFVKYLEDRGYLKDTIVFVLSDHLSMKTKSVWNDLNEFERTNYLSIIEPGGEKKLIERAGSTLDTFPTLLAKLGYALENHSAGLGVDLTSDRQNLTEIYGLDDLDRMIINDTKLREANWGLDPKEAM